MRYKEFNRNKVLENCIQLFWNRGFGPCTISDIVARTNVNRFSLYNEFENKDGILFQSLILYNNRYSNKCLAILKEQGTLKNILLGFYKSYLQTNEEHPPGCYMIHIATELADSNETIKNLLDEYLQELERNMVELLTASGLKKEHNLNSAKHLVGLFCNAMCYCLIQNKEEQTRYIENSIDLILEKNMSWEEI